MEYMLANPVPFTVFAAGLLACRSSDKDTRDRGFYFSVISGLIAFVQSLPTLLSRLFKWGVDNAMEKALQLVSAVKDALNSLLPGLGKLLEPLEDFFKWIKKNAGSVAQVLVMVVGGYIVLKVIRR